MIKFMLNLHKSGNYAFFCPVSRLHLTVSNPIGFANEVTSYILRGLKSNVIIQLEDDNTEKSVEKSSPSPKSEEQKVDTNQPEEPEAPAIEDKSESAETSIEETQEQKEEEKAVKKSTQRKKK